MESVLYVDMDNVLVNFQSGIDRLSPEMVTKYKGDLDEVPGIFSLMDPLEAAIESYKKLSQHFDTYFFLHHPGAIQPLPRTNSLG